MSGVVGDPNDDAATPKDVRTLRNRMVFSLAVAALIMAMMAIPSAAELFPFSMDFALLALATPVQFWAGRGFYTSAWSAARHLTSNMNTLIAVGTSTAYLYSLVVTIFGDASILRMVAQPIPTSTPPPQSSRWYSWVNSSRLGPKVERPTLSGRSWTSNQDRTGCQGRIT